MSEVSLQVGGRSYTVSCADGEEAHVRRLAALVDGKLTAMGDSLAPGDAKNLLFAALILADEVEEARRSGGVAQRSETVPAAVIEETTARGLDELADRLEAVASVLENAAGSA